jgi:hypothetical protein
MFTLMVCMLAAPARSPKRLSLTCPRIFGPEII